MIPGHYIVLYRDTVDGAAAGGRLPALNRRVLSRYGVPEAAVRSAFAGSQSGVVCRLSPGQAAALRGAPEVALVEPDRVVSIAACITPVDSTTLGWGTRRTGYADGTGKTAWVIDSGIDLHHPDLHVDGERSLSFLEGQSSAADLNGHGTHVAGIIGARNNAIGTLGVASGATLVALKVLDQLGEGSVSAVVKALNHVAAHARRGDVVNISLVGDTLSQALDRAVVALADKGILFAVAAGNHARDAAAISPSRVNHPNVFTVSAMDQTDTWAGFSNFGRDVVDVAAPGVSIVSTGRHGTYASMSGTSLATPHVAGLLLLDGRNFVTSGTVKNDPDGQPDPVAHKQ